MSHDARQQKKLAKAKAKRQEKRSLIAKQTSKDPTVRFANAAAWPVLDSLVAEGIWERGMGVVLLSRQMSDGGIALTSMVVDTFCMGVKDCLLRTVSTYEYQNLLSRYRKGGPLITAKPEYVVKLVTEAVAYARAISLPPHEDYRNARLLFAGIDPAACSETFEFGHQGTPLYIQGPHETLAQAQSIMRRVDAAGGALGKIKYVNETMRTSADGGEASTKALEDGRRVLDTE